MSSYFQTIYLKNNFVFRKLINIIVITGKSVDFFLQQIELDFFGQTSIGTLYQLNENWNETM